MNNFVKGFLLMVLAVTCVVSCGPDIDPEGGKEVVTPGQKPENVPSYDNLAAYDVLKSYVDRTASPDFKLGAAVTVSNFLKMTMEYKTITANFDEMTAGNAMKQSSILRNNGTMDFTQVRNFINAAEHAGMTVYGHTLAWHSQQSDEYLNGLIKGQRVDVPAGMGEYVLFETDFNGGSSPFNGWGNNSTRDVTGGVFKVSNPSVTENDWDVQFARDFDESFESGQRYRLTFRIKGSSSGTLGAGLQIVDGYRSAGEFPDIDFDTQWKDVEVECSCTAGGGNRLIFSLGKFAGDIHIDDFEFSAVGLDYSYSNPTAAEKKQILTDAMDRWIKAMMEVTATKVSAWDAVNEAISSRDTDGDGFYELESGAWGSSDNFYWQDYLGSEDYVCIVIAKARKYYEEYGGTAPLRLFINDYNLESDWDDNKKLRSLIHWIGIWESDGVTRIDGIGTQMHISCYADPNTQKSKENHVVNMLKLMAATGKLVKISELDMGYVDRNGNTVATVDVTDEQLREMADFYDFIVRKYMEIVPPAQQYGITQWCPTDAPGALGTGWRGGEPVGLWDLNYNRKYAYAGFANGLMGD